MTTPTTDTRPIAHAAREADIDLRVLTTRPPMQVPDTVRHASKEIGEAFDRQRDVYEQRNEAASGCREALMSIVTARSEHSAELTRAALTGAAEPKDPNVEPLFKEARRQYRRTVALNRAAEESKRNLQRVLADSTDALLALRAAERAAAQEALDLYVKVDAVLAHFAKQRSEAFWLAEFITSSAYGRTNHSLPVKPVPQSVEEAQKSIAEEREDRALTGEVTG